MKWSDEWIRVPSELCCFVGSECREAVCQTAGRSEHSLHSRHSSLTRIVPAVHWFDLSWGLAAKLVTHLPAHWQMKHSYHLARVALSSNSSLHIPRPPPACFISLRLLFMLHLMSFHPMCSDSFARLYDRRMLPTLTATAHSSSLPKPPRHVMMLAPKHLSEFVSASHA